MTSEYHVIPLINNNNKKESGILLLLSYHIAWRRLFFVTTTERIKKRNLLCSRNHVVSGDDVVYCKRFRLRRCQTISARKISVFRVTIIYTYYVSVTIQKSVGTFLLFNDWHYWFDFSHTPLFDYEKVLPEKPDLKLPLYVSDSIEFINGLKSPRFIKTHLPYKLLPKKLRDQSTKAKVRSDFRVPIYIQYRDRIHSLKTVIMSKIPVTLILKCYILFK